MDRYQFHSRLVKAGEASGIIQLGFWQGAKIPQRVHLSWPTPEFWQQKCQNIGSRSGMNWARVLYHHDHQQPIHHVASGYGWWTLVLKYKNEIDLVSMQSASFLTFWLSGFAG